MSEYIVDVLDEEADLLLRVYGIDGATVLGCRLTGEIVRCRDCKWSRIHDGRKYPGERYRGMTYCIARGDGMQGEWTEPDGFCHRAKRKDENR